MGTLSFKDAREIILGVLQDLEEESTTVEIMNIVVKISKECKDQVPHVLLQLLKEGIIHRGISKTKRGITWKIHQSVLITSSD